MEKIDGAPFVFIIPHEMTERLKKIQKRHNMSRAKAMRMIVSFGLDVYDDYEAIGFVKMAEIFKRAEKAIKKNVGQQSLFEG